MTRTGVRKNNKLMQFKITLLGVKPVVWRRIQVPQNFNFQRFHMAIQDSMGWFDCHLHSFSVSDPQTPGETIQLGFPDEEFSEYSLQDETQYLIRNYFKDVGNKAEYQYDFGDCWEHKIIYEGLHNAKSKGPICIDGKNACPPEDIGGDSGFMEFLQIMKNPDHEEYKENDEWYKDGRTGCDGKSFKHGKFKKNKVRFRNSTRGWNYSDNDL